MTSLYVYAFVDRTASPFTIGGHTVRVVKAGPVYAAVERLSERPVVSEAALVAQHEIVTRVAGSADAVLPARFGSFLDPAELRTIVDQHHDALQAALDLVRGRVQMTIRADRVRPFVAPDTPPGLKDGTSYLEERRARAKAAVPGELADIDAAVGAMVAATASSIRDAGWTKDDADVLRHDKLNTDGAPGLQTPRRVAVYHLIARRDQLRYRRALASLLRTQPAVRVTGPWAPFAFTPELWR
jgi:hypothetical protein